jgi:hypothetical protein
MRGAMPEVPIFRWSQMDLGLDSADAHIEYLASVAEALY